MASAPQLDDDNADVLLVCSDGSSFATHANLLRRCEYFATALRQNTKTNPEEMTIVQVPSSVDSDDMKMFLHAEFYDALCVVSEADFPRYQELSELFQTSYTDDSEADDDDDDGSESDSSLGEVSRQPIAIPSDIDCKSDILVFKEMLTDLKPSNVQSTIERLPVFNRMAASLVGDLILLEFIRSRNMECRKAHFALYKEMHARKTLFEGDVIDVSVLLASKVEFHFRQHVVDRSEDHYPIIAKNGVFFNAIDEHVSDVRQQLRADVRHHGRAIVCLFGEFFKMGWISYRSVDMAISALLTIAGNEKLEYFCRLLLLVEADMQKQQPDRELGLAKYTERIAKVMAEAMPAIRQMYKERQGLKAKIMAQSYGIDSQMKTEMSSHILEQLYWMRVNVSSLNAEQYYKESGGLAVHGLESPVQPLTSEDLKPIVDVKPTPPIPSAQNSNGRVIRVPRVEFFKNLRIMQEKKVKDSIVTNNNKNVAAAKVNAAKPNAKNQPPSKNKSKMDENSVPNGDAKPKIKPPNRPNRKQRDRERYKTFMAKKAGDKQ